MENLQNDKSFFAYLNRMKYINRWGLMRNTATENILEHSGQTAMLAHMLALIGNKYFGKNYDLGRVCLFALYHDANETITGDLPTPVKYFNQQINDSYKEIEELSKNKLLEMLPGDFRDEYRDILFFEEHYEDYRRLIKSADKISAHIKCIEEVKSGNSEFVAAKKATLESIKSMGLPEADYFTENFVPAFEYSLDELGGL
ncbi:MAG: 5'-deoxynucleotidase [Ruminococcaceae bacterium]|nr:5'-deoxynucleotidase [Oscillospiraceae bacterium]